MMGKRSDLPPMPIGGLAYVDWTFGRHDLSKIEHTVRVLTEGAPNSDMYLQMYEANIGRIHQYYGLQTTNGRCIFSAFELTKPEDARVGPGSYKLASDDEGNYVSVRRDFGSLPVGEYKTELVRAEADGESDWYDYYVTFPNADRHHIGGIRFPRTVAHSPVSIEDGGSTWLEFWDNSQGDSRFVPVPEWSVSFAVTGNGSAPINARAKYSARADGYNMPQADMNLQPDGFLRIDVGESVARTPN